MLEIRELRPLLGILNVRLSSLWCMSMGRVFSRTGLLSVPPAVATRV